MPRPSRLEGVYLVTSPRRPVSRLASIVEAALRAGASIIQFRDKGDLTEVERTACLHELRRLGHRHRVPLIVNDDPQLALASRADGVHVGRGDPAPERARSLLGPRAIVGVTVYGSPGEERQAARAGADYVAVGPFFPSPTKPQEPVLPLRVLDEVVARSPLPVFAIGGITPDRARILARQGAAGIAVVSFIMDSRDPHASTARLLRAFRSGLHERDLRQG